MYGGFGAPVGGVPIALSEQPPPEDMPDFFAFRVGRSNATEAGHWISRKLHELNRVADKLRVPGPP